MTMLLTLCAGSLRGQLSSSSQGAGMTLFDVPQFVIRNLQLHGLNIPASLLARWTPQDLDRLRDRADKAACPCLVLIEDSALPLAAEKPAQRDAAVERVRKLAMAAHRLGCNSIALKVQAPDNDEAFDAVVEQVREVLPFIERLELNLLLAPAAGLTASTERLTSLIKRIGGFRIGSLPSFGAAAEAGGGDPIDPLRKLAPYAGAIHATVQGFNKKGAHKPYDLAACVSAIRSVGFLNTLAIDFVGDGDAVANIEKARDLLQAAIDDDEA